MLENDKGEHPNLWNVGYFVLFITVMGFNLYNFGKFQKYQEKMAARIEDIEFEKSGQSIRVNKRT